MEKLKKYIYKFRKGKAYMKKILAVVTNIDKYQGFNINTGLWLGEMVHFYHELNSTGEFEITIASVNGGKIPIDPASVTGVMYDSISKNYHSDEKFMKLLENTHKIDDLLDKDFDGIYFTGGHGTMFDFPQNEIIKSIINRIYASGGIVSAVCHGVGALTGVPDIIKGKKLTGYSNVEEKLVKHTKHVPFLLEDRLKAQEAIYKKALIPFTSYVVKDGKLITGQNPQSTKKLAKEVIEALS